ncbi:GNS1/SUR4 family domain-containing protein [Phthorimaea operculella]|nr:GNS1/SUR4 family domain-containing protein [Phthorimaea operculella]
MEQKSNGSFWDWKGTVDYVDDWFLIESPYLMLSIMVTYLFFVLKCGPKVMENRPAYTLRKTLLVYNAFQVIVSCYLFNVGINLIKTNGLVENGYCSFSDEKRQYMILSATYYYFLAKLSELMDTVFFVLRKKWNQITFLHVYHHTIMYFVTWLVLKYEPTYSLVFLGTINCFVHIVMYGYYGLSAFPHLRPYLWWKKYITKLQLLQFTMILIQLTWNYNVSTCPTTHYLLVFAWSNLVLFIYLFSRFYINSYSQKKEKQKTGEKNGGIALKTVNDSNGNYRHADKSR